MLMNQSVILSINTVIFLIALGLMVPIVTLFIECSAALLLNKPKTGDNSAYQPSIAILVPAHNEALGIGATLKTLLPQLTEQDRLIVIADNCNDDTAAIARQAGAIVIERQDTERKGKGYALDYGLKFLEANPPEVVVTVDADCIVHSGAINRIASLAATSKCPVQSTYLMEHPANPKPKDAVSALAFKMKNLVRPTGLQQLGQPCLLTGSGMAFPWSVIHQAPIASGNIVEDMQLGLDLAIAGNSPVFCPAANVTGRLPQQQQVAKNQRKRWEHGHLQTLITQVPRLIRVSVVQRRFELLVLALDLCVPPLSLLVTIWAIAMVGSLLTGAWIPSILFGIQGLLVLISIIGAWFKFARDDISGLQLISVPFYVLWKIPLYLTFLFKPQTNWVRTERDI
jgi:cellulose synthase/poly-beta-1,6-N-acetylglucosamine synthase-like glycosyltransferase